MEDSKLTQNTWVPLGAVAASLGFIIASAMWAANIEAKAEKAIEFQDKLENTVNGRLDRVGARLDRMEDKIDKIYEKVK